MSELSVSKHIKLVFLGIIFIILALNSYWLYNQVNRSDIPSQTNQSQKPLQKAQSELVLPQKQAIGQLLLTSLAGEQLTASEAAWLRNGVVSGYLLFARNIKNPNQLKALTTSMYVAATPSGILPLVLIDQEGGGVSRIPWIDTTAQPDITTIKQAKAIGQKRGQALHTLGITMNLSPVIDSSSNQNAFINVQKRGFSKEAGQLAAAMVAGYHQSNLLSAAKHFPGGLAQTATDPHQDLPYLPLDTNQVLLLSQEFKPVIAKHVDAIIVSHELYPLIDSRPVPLSNWFLQTVLRDSLQFEGVIMVDDLSMGAVKNHYQVTDYAQDSLESGVDLLIVSEPAEYIAVSESLLKALFNKQLSSELLNQHLNKVLALKHKMSRH